MLVLTRHEGERILIDNGRIVVQVIQVRGPRDRPVVKLGIEAPRDVPVHRQEIQQQIDDGPASGKHRQVQQSCRLGR